MLSTPAPSDGGECSPLTAVAETKRDFDVTYTNSTATTQTTVIRTRDSGADTAAQGCKAIHTQKETALPQNGSCNPVSLHSPSAPISSVFPV